MNKKDLKFHLYNDLLKYEDLISDLSFDETLYKVLEKIKKENKKTSLKSGKVKIIKSEGCPFTSKDLLCSRDLEWEEEWGDGKPTYSFYLKYEGKEVDIYHDADKISGVIDEESGNNLLFELIPEDFSEFVENGYSFPGSHKDALLILKIAGIEFKNT